MYNKKTCGLTALFLLLTFLLALFGGSACAEETAPLAELHLEKNGLPLDLRLLKMEIEDGKLVLSVSIDGITEWKDEDPPSLIINYGDSGMELKTKLFANETVKSLPAGAKNYKMTTKFPSDGDALPDQLLIDIGEKDPLPFWLSEDAVLDAAVETAVKAADEIVPKKDTGAQAAIDEAQKLFDAGEYYKAALAVRDCQAEYPNSDAAQKGDEMMSEIKTALKDKEPKTGEIERNFPFFGMNCVRATALTGPFEMIITDTEDEKLNTRFYVRQGDTSEVYLPSSFYSVIIRQGDIWFGDEIGFGELCESSDFGGDTLDMTSRVKGNTMSYHEWKPVF